MYLNERINEWLLLTIGAGGHRRILTNGNLMISPVSRDDEGVYTCVASNKMGMDESQGRLIVLRKFAPSQFGCTICNKILADGPRIVQQLDPHIIRRKGETIRLYCEAHAEELLDMAYLWTHNGLRIRDTDIRNSNFRLVSWTILNDLSWLRLLKLMMFDVSNAYKISHF